ncbi:MAG: hypothetical protein K2H70_06255, partial [Bacteroidales bacterium]|nr:hypothetical protein [Bacteroidales bacterium]
MDEPTNGLDIPSKSQLRRLIASAATEDKCFVISTHQVRDLEQLIDPVVIMERFDSAKRAMPSLLGHGRGAKTCLEEERQRVLLNNSMAEIDSRLWFGVAAEKPENCLYAEPAMGGYFVVTPRTEGMPDSKIQLEALFNAAIANRAYFQETFGKNGARDGRMTRPDAPSAPVVENKGPEPASPEAMPEAAARISPLKRFGCFLWAEIFMKYKHYFLMLGIIFGFYMWRWISYLMSSSDFANETVYGAWSVAVVLMIFAPYMLYRDLYHPVKGFSFMMRPAGNVTKFAAVWVQSVVVVPGLLLLWCGLLDSVMNLLVNHSLSGSNILKDGLNLLADGNGNGGFWVLAILLVFGPQASVLWGTCFFKRHKLLKLMATYFGLVCLFSWVVIRL